MTSESVSIPVCYTCETPINIWEGDLITEAWQKGGSNHYQFDCPVCDTKQELGIAIDGEYTEQSTGVHILGLLTR